MALMLISERRGGIRIKENIANNSHNRYILKMRLFAYEGHQQQLGGGQARIYGYKTMQLYSLTTIRLTFMDMTTLLSLTV